MSTDKLLSVEEWIIEKDMFKGTVYGASSFYDWCMDNKIKVKEPKNRKTKLYDTFILVLDTDKKKKLFKDKYPNLNT